jgi:general secretion pathway protein D
LKRTIDTTVLVKDKSTIVIGGLIDHAFSNVEYRVPCLGDIPIMGWLFKSVGKRDQKTNLYIFLSPRVVAGHLEAEEIYRLKKKEIDDVQAGEIKLYDPEDRPE